MPLPFTDLVQFIGERFGRYESAPMPSLPTAKAIGDYGERVAASYLRRHGYKVLTRNFLVPHGEIDLICRLDRLLVFVEVRSRSEDSEIRPADTISFDKEESLRHAALEYLKLLANHPVSYRFDAVEVRLQPGKVPRCEIIPDVVTG